MTLVIRTRAVLDQIPAYVPGRSVEAVAAEHGITDVVKLASNEAPFGPLPAARAAVADAIAGVNRYPDDRNAALTDALAARYEVDPSQVLIGAGSVDLCRLAFAATIDAGDEVVFAWPSFEMYPILAQQVGAVAVRVPLRDQTHDLDAMTDALSERTRLVFVCNPNNPTGTAVDRAAMTRFLERVPSDCFVVLDEAYREFVTAADFPDGLDMLAAHDNVAVLRTFSKAYGLAALRVGYAIAHPDVIGVLRKVAMPFRVNGLAQVAALASLGAHDEMRERVDGVIAERARLARTLAHLGLTASPSEANFLWLDVPEQAAALGEFSERRGVVLRVFAGVGVRITVGTPAEDDRVVKVLEGAIAEGVV
ncbi:MAG: histidinol-phosphate transaminase [Acidimicrobiia bacterium]